ncbi:MAG: hypothetical protein AAF633_02505 [Chloroflexota bacterium]
MSENSQAPETPEANKKIKLGLLTKILVSTVLAGLIPLLIVSLVALRGYRTIGESASSKAIEALDNQSVEALQLQTNFAASSIEMLLNNAAQDTLMLSSQPVDPRVYETFYDEHTGEISFPSLGGEEVYIEIPIYRELTYIDQNGQEQFKIRDGVVLEQEELTNVSNLENTTYRFEAYFAETIDLPAREVYVSEVTAYHVYQSNQPGNLLNVSEYTPSVFGEYEGVIRFGSPIYSSSGQLLGILLLSLDHRHFINLVTHFDPAQSDQVIWPQYQTGNYAYVFDHEGYTIAHPLLNRIRGLDNSGRILPYMQGEMTSEERNRVPFNLAYASWADPNYVRIFDEVLAGKNSALAITNNIGIVRLNVFAPIKFEHGIYAESGIFGGVVVGAELEIFREPANEVSALISEQEGSTRTTFIILGILSIGLLVGCGIMISQNVTRPIRKLTAVAQAMRDGVLKRVLLQEIIDRRFEDEVNLMADVFLDMGEQIKLREEKLRVIVESLKDEVDEMKLVNEAESTIGADFLHRIEAEASIARKRRKRKIQERELA